VLWNKLTDSYLRREKKKKQLLMQFEKNGKEPSEDFFLLKVELEEENKI
jgi:hypothetical protein